MTFNQKLDRHFNNLDAADDELLEAKEQSLLEQEALEDEILKDQDLFARLALDYARANLSMPLDLAFLDFGVKRLMRERESQWKGGWSE